MLIVQTFNINIINCICVLYPMLVIKDLQMIAAAEVLMFKVIAQELWIRTGWG